VRVTKAVITAAGPGQRALPLQRLVDRDGEPKSVLRIIVEEALSAGVEEICVVVGSGDDAAYAAAAAGVANQLRFVVQAQPRGYGHAVLCAAPFVGAAPFLHLVGDHLYVSKGAQRCAHQLVAVATSEACSVSAVQPSRESLLPFYGTIGGRRLPGKHDLYGIELVREKPTPTEAEQQLMVPGLRVGHYLCFFGMHVLSPTVMEILARHAAQHPDQTLQLSPALDELARHERYLALANIGRRYDVGGKYGLLTAQLALALDGEDRAEVLAQLVELLALR
jgi:UTP--glucose-1-phosphate uridylyltransferase